MRRRNGKHFLIFVQFSGFQKPWRVGADGGEGPPVPIPNTAVKPICAHDTWLEAARENRQAPTLRRPSGLSGGPFFWLPDYSRGADSFFCRLFRTFQLFKESENHIMNC